MESWRWSGDSLGNRRNSRRRYEVEFWDEVHKLEVTKSLERDEVAGVKREYR